MIIRIKKNPDGRTSLSCTRPDGTTTWQSLNPTQAKFFPRHDLTHYAVETVLSEQQGFYSLVAAGWDLTDFGAPWPRGKIPPEATFSEMIVGLLDLERATGHLVTAADVNARLDDFSRENAVAVPGPVSEADLDRIRQRRAELFAQWESVKPGDALELPFPTRIRGRPTSP
jgi:hypothetical protein